jgi:hypothetical protein
VLCATYFLHAAKSPFVTSVGRFAERQEFTRAADGRPDSCLLLSPQLGLRDTDHAAHDAKQAKSAAAAALQVLTLVRASNTAVDRGRAPANEEEMRQTTLWVGGIPDCVAAAPGALLAE